MCGDVDASGGATNAISDQLFTGGGGGREQKRSGFLRRNSSSSHSIVISELCAAAMVVVTRFTRCGRTRKSLVWADGWLWQKFVPKRFVHCTAIAQNPVGLFPDIVFQLARSRDSHARMNDRDTFRMHIIEPIHLPRCGKLKR